MADLQTLQDHLEDLMIERDELLEKVRRLEAIVDRQNLIAKEEGENNGI